MHGRPPGPPWQESGALGRSGVPALLRALTAGSRGETTRHSAVVVALLDWEMAARSIGRIIVRDGHTVKIVILDGRTLDPDPQAWACLGRLGEIVFHDFSGAEDIPGRASGAEVLVINKSPIRSDLIACLPELRFITITATGFDMRGSRSSPESRIPVSNVPEYGTFSVAAGYVLRSAPALPSRRAPCRCRPRRRVDSPARLLASQDPACRAGRQDDRHCRLRSDWPCSLAKPPRPSACTPWPMTLLRTRPRRLTRVAWCDLDELFARSDVISLHCPLTDQTAGMVNRERLGRAKPTAFLINTARGALVVEDDLAEALNAEDSPAPPSMWCRASRSSPTIRS